MVVVLLIVVLLVVLDGAWAAPHEVAEGNYPPPKEVQALGV